MNYMAQDRPDTELVARVFSQIMASPTEGTEYCLKRVIRYLVSHPRGAWTYPRGSTDGPLRSWTQSDWAGSVASRKSCSVGDIRRMGNILPLEQSTGKCGVALRGS